MKKKLFRMYKLFLILVGIISFALPANLVTAASPGFRTIGYLPDYDFALSKSIVDFDQLTDINYFSLIPQVTGELKFTDSGSPALLEELVTQAHEKDVRVGVSIGGWGMSENFAEATNSDNRSKFIKEIVAFVDKYHLDTVDIDWEYPAVEESEQFTIFIRELKVALGDKTCLSICVPTGVASNGEITGKWGQHFPPEALGIADWINIMSYDAQVEGTPNHSPVDIQKNSLNYWNELMGGDKIGQLVGGVPFYGKAENGAVMTYARIMEEHGGVLVTDHVELNDQEYYFNNKETLQQKVQDTIDIGALGIMIWSPTQDAKLGSASRLMDVVVETVKNNDLVLAKAKFAHEEEVQKGNITWSQSLLILAGVLCLIGILFFTGRMTQTLPQTFGEKNVNRKKLGKLVGSLLICVALLLVLFALLPIYVVGLIVLAIVLGLVYILKT